MRIFYSVIIVAALGACSGAIGPIPNAGSSGSQLQDATLGARAFELEVRGEPQPNASLAIRSIGVIATINGRSERGYIPAHCSVVDQGGIAKGCVITAKQNLHIKKMVAGLFTKAAAKGCLAAAGKWHGYVPAGRIIPIVFYWTGYC